MHQVGDFLVGALDAVRQPAITGVDAAVVHPHFGAVLDLLEDLRAGVVDQNDVVGDQNLRPQVGVAAGNRRRRVDHPDHAGIHERVRGRPVEVKNVEHRDIAGPHPPQQAVDVAVDPGVSRDARSCIGITCEKR